MRNYQQKRHNPYLLPHNVYMQVLYLIRDYDRMQQARADVETALVYINIPFNDADGTSLFERIARSKQYAEPDPEQQMEIEVTDMIQMIVNRYRTEVEAGIELIRTYRRMLPYLQRDMSGRWKKQKEL